MVVLQLFVVVSCRFDYQQRILKTFPDPGYFSSLAGIVWIWHLLVNFHVYCWTFYLAIAQTLQSWCSQRTMVVWSLSVTAVGLVLAEDAKNVFKHISTPRMGTCNIYIFTGNTRWKYSKYPKAGKNTFQNFHTFLYY